MSAARDALALAQEYGVSARLTFSNSLLREEHLSDRKMQCTLRAVFAGKRRAERRIVHSELLTDHLRTRYPALYRVVSRPRC